MKLRPKQNREHVLPIDLTAMVDMVFLLIIFFLTTSSLVDMTRARLDLPQEPGEEEIRSLSPGLVVNVDAEGRYLVESKEVTLGEVILMVAQEIEKAGGSAMAVDVLVRADRAAPLRFVNDLADGLIDMKVRNWRLGTAVPLGPRGGASP